MVFSSYIFLFWFLPLTLAIYFALAGEKMKSVRTLWLTVVSFVFYGWWRPDFLSLMVISTALDWNCGKKVADPAAPHRKRWLLLSIIGNLGLLGYFKYANFGIDTFNSIMQNFGVGPIPFAQVVLPVGISFYTFQTMSYTIDIYRGEAKPAKSVLDMACYVALFPQLVAGPIVRYQDIDDQLRSRVHSWEKFGSGALQFMIGFAKKILIANSAGEISDAAFLIDRPGAATAWAGMLGYTIQIYFDFSGYSDMACGLGRMMGFEFLKNFDSPYRSKSITEFWRRWHISLSTWLRDYLYIPLGGNRGTALRTYVNLTITMLLGGLWHGAKWTFVIWGAFHGILLAVERAIGKKAPWGWLPKPLQVLVTLVLVMIGWVFFRADNVPAAFAVLSGMVGMGGGLNGLTTLLTLPPITLGLAGIGLLLVWAGMQSDHLVARARVWSTLVIFALFLLATCHMFFQRFNQFLYSQF